MKYLCRSCLLLLLFGSIAIIKASPDQTERLMVDSAKLFIQSLNRVQRSRTLFDFDAPHRQDWHFFPGPGFVESYGYVRNGITYSNMTARQRHLANALLSSGLSTGGLHKAIGVMTLEDIVRVIENDQTGYRDTENYHFSIFGKPSLAGNWGWRVEGHHLSLHYTMHNGDLISSSPVFFGANPHEVAQGVHKGLRVLGREEDLALALLKSLDGEQKKKAIFLDTAPDDIFTMADKRAELDGTPKGLPASQLDVAQYGLLLDLIAEYANIMPEKVAAERLRVASQALRSQLFFAWAGRTDRPDAIAIPIGGRTTNNREAQGNYYRVQGPSFLIEYDNTQNKSNHSHSVWRDFEGDFGQDLLTLHHQRFDHQADNLHTKQAHNHVIHPHRSDDD
jgi:hypothetical protein